MPGDLPVHDRVLLWLSAVVVVLIGPGIILGAPAWSVALAASVVLVAGFAVRRPEAVHPRRLARYVPWSVIVLAIVLFSLVNVVVDHAHDFLQTVFGTGGSLAALAQLGLSTGVLANVINNLPAYLVAEPFAHTTSRLVTVLVGVNVGPMVLVWGSLANLLWLRACRTRGVSVSAVRFGLEGLLVVPFAVAAGVLAVWLT